MECIYFDKNSIVWEFPRVIQDSLFLTGNNEMFDVYHKRLKNIYEIVSNNVNKDNVKLLYNGMPFVEIKKQYTKGMIFNNLFINTLAEFDAINKKIYLYSGRLSGSSLNHELLHLLSSYYDKEKDILYSGFEQTSKSGNMGEAFNEGYTEYQNGEIFHVNVNDTIYVYEIIIIKLLEQVIGKSRMKDLYFHGDLYNFINELAKYTNISNIKKMIYKSDYILRYRRCYFKNHKVKEYLLEMNAFILEIYTNYLLYLYNNNYIDVCELDLLYSYFINELKNILDVDLPINKDLLHRNIMDNKVIYLNKIKQRI